MTTDFKEELTQIVMDYTQEWVHNNIFPDTDEEDIPSDWMELYDKLKEFANELGACDNPSDEKERMLFVGAMNATDSCIDWEDILGWMNDVINDDRDSFQRMMADQKDEEEEKDEKMK